MLDPEGMVANWNTGAQRFKGYTEQEIVGQHFSRFYTDEDKASGLPQRGLETAMREGRFENEGWRVRNDGTRFWAHVVIDAIRNEQGDLLGFAKVTRDITDKKNAQEALEATRAALFQSQKMRLSGRSSAGSRTTSTTCSRCSLGTSNCFVSACRTTHAPRGFSTTRCRRPSAALR